MLIDLSKTRIDFANEVWRESKCLERVRKDGEGRSGSVNDGKVVGAA